MIKLIITIIWVNMIVNVTGISLMSILAVSEVIPISSIGLMSVLVFVTVMISAKYKSLIQKDLSLIIATVTAIFMIPISVILSIIIVKEIDISGYQDAVCDSIKMILRIIVPLILQIVLISIAILPYIIKKDNTGLLKRFIIIMIVIWISLIFIAMMSSGFNISIVEILRVILLCGFLGLMYAPIITIDYLLHKLIVKISYKKATYIKVMLYIIHICCCIKLIQIGLGYIIKA